MTIVEALKSSDVLRRKDDPRHCGTHGEGWVHVDYLLSNLSTESALRLTRADLMADDWEPGATPARA